MKNSVLIVGAGKGLSYSLGKLFNSHGYRIGLVARDINKISHLSEEINASLFQFDVSKPDSVHKLFKDVDQKLPNLDLVIFNPSKRFSGKIEELNVNQVKEALDVTCYAGFLVAQQATKRMLKQGKGSIFFTGASASKKGFANSSVFAMGKFGLRGLAQSLARELHPKNIHICHVIIDGIISKKGISENLNNENNKLDPDEIAKNYYNIYLQEKNCWTWEIELRPWLENF
tara:strand:+ start:420 stop:1109 length:690 start_codon:yes stop_codon:yes gene_type:complete